MLLKGYQKEIFRPKCNPGFQSVHCIAHLDQDIAEALPYLNAQQSEQLSSYMAGFSLEA
ncbi:MAG: hypothetical protein ACOC79_01795 [Thermodesulfobacteriota bacterium]